MKVTNNRQSKVIMSGYKDEEESWVKAAMSDDTMVVDILLQLHRSAPLPSLKPVVATLPFDWNVRQRRSKHIAMVNNHPQNSGKKSGTRASPTTPLSWSGGATSLSGGCGGADAGHEESSRPSQKLLNLTRSKVTVNNDKANAKKSRKKKTLAELREEENFLLKERRELKREISALRVNLEKQRATNERLKRMKLEFQPSPERGTVISPVEATCSTSQQKMPTCQPSSQTTPQLVPNNSLLQSSASNGSDSQAEQAKFVLPDLNVPFEDA